MFRSPKFSSTQVSPSELLYAFVTYPMRATCSVHLSLIDESNNIWRRQRIMGTVFCVKCYNSSLFIEANKNEALIQMSALLRSAARG